MATGLISFDVLLIKKIKKNNESVFYLSIGITKKQIFYARYFGMALKILMFSLPVNVFGLIASDHKLTILLVYLCHYLFVVLLINIRLILINYTYLIKELRFIELIVFMVIYSLSFIFLPTEILKENAYWIRYLQYLTPTGWIMQIILNIDRNVFRLVFPYLFFIVAVLNLLTFQAAKTQT